MPATANSVKAALNLPSILMASVTTAAARQDFHGELIVGGVMACAAVGTASARAMKTLFQGMTRGYSRLLLVLGKQRSTINFEEVGVCEVEMPFKDGTPLGRRLVTEITFSGRRTHDDQLDGYRMPSLPHDNTRLHTTAHDCRTAGITGRRELTLRSTTGDSRRCDGGGSDQYSHDGMESTHKPSRFCFAVVSASANSFL